MAQDLKQKSLLLGAGGIFLARTYTNNTHSKQSTRTDPSTLKNCDKFTKVFLKLHHRYVITQPLDGIDSIITYINGNLSLLVKKQDEKLELLARVNTAALHEKYKTMKSIVHASVATVLVFGSIIKNKGKSLQDEKDLRKISGELKKLQRSKNMQENSSAISLMITCIKKALALKDLNALVYLKAQLLKAVEPVNFRCGANATDLQWDAMEEIMNLWRLEHPINLENTRILIACAKGPRKKLLEAQFFHHLYEMAGLIEKDVEDKENDYISTYEMLPEQLISLTDEKLVYELKRKLLNAQLALDLMGDSEAMNKDALSEHARRRRELAKSCPLHKNSLNNSNAINKDVSEKDALLSGNSPSDLRRHSLFAIQSSKYESTSCIGDSKEQIICDEKTKGGQFITYSIFE